MSREKTRSYPRRHGWMRFVEGFGPCPSFLADTPLQCHMGPEDVLQSLGYHTTHTQKSPPFSRVRERRLQPTVEAQIQEQQ